MAGLVQAVMGKTLGDDLYAQAQTMQGLHNRPGAGGSAFGGGWYGYVEKDLRNVLGEPVTAPVLARVLRQTARRRTAATGSPAR